MSQTTKRHVMRAAFCALLALSTALVAAPPVAAMTTTDGFESGILSPPWTIYESGTGDVSTVSPGKDSATAFLSSPGAFGVAAIDRLYVGYDSGTFKVWFHDDLGGCGSGTAKHQLASLLEDSAYPSSVRGLGVHTTVSACNYSYRLDGSNLATSVARTSGWHEFKWTWGASSILMEIDGADVYSSYYPYVPDQTTMGHSWNASPGTAKYDGVVYHGFEDCEDGIDNDGDGLTDYPADGSCASPSDPSEEAACADGVDNDMDGYTDYPSDPGCSSATDASEMFACADSADNDGDGLTDYPADPGCLGPSDNDERGVCEDGVDNDGDGVTDYPSDPGCTSRSDTTETTTCASAGACVDHGLVLGAPQDFYTVTLPVPSQEGLEVVGYVDRYSFFGGSVSLFCVVLVSPATSNACADAGGIFGSRFYTIVESVPVPTGPNTNLQFTVQTCTHHVSLFVEGVGLNKFPVTALCV